MFVFQLNSNSRWVRFIASKPLGRMQRRGGCGGVGFIGHHVEISKTLAFAWYFSNAVRIVHCLRASRTLKLFSTTTLLSGRPRTASVVRFGHHHDSQTEANAYVYRCSLFFIPRSLPSHAQFRARMGHYLRVFLDRICEGPPGIHWHTMVPSSSIHMSITAASTLHALSLPFNIFIQVQK